MANPLLAVLLEKLKLGAAITDKEASEANGTAVSGSFYKVLFQHGYYYHHKSNSYKKIPDYVYRDMVLLD